MITKSLLERIIAKIVITDSPCWDWSGSTTVGYPTIREGKAGAPLLYVHRVICEIWHGPSKTGQETRHLCNNKRCFHPDHICWGTHSENCLDIPKTIRVDKSRHASNIRWQNGR